MATLWLKISFRETLLSPIHYTVTSLEVGLSQPTPGGPTVGLNLAFHGPHFSAFRPLAWLGLLAFHLSAPLVLMAHAQHVWARFAKELASRAAEGTAVAAMRRVAELVSGGDFGVLAGGSGGSADIAPPPAETATPPSNVDIPEAWPTVLAGAGVAALAAMAGGAIGALSARAPRLLVDAPGRTAEATLEMREELVAVRARMAACTTCTQPV